MPLAASVQVQRTNLLTNFLTTLFPLYMGHSDSPGACLQLCACMCFINKLNCLISTIRVSHLNLSLASEARAEEQARGVGEVPPSQVSPW